MAIWLWIGFIGFLLAFMAADLFVFHRRNQVITIKTALVWTAVCVVLALAFVPIIYIIYERHIFGMGMADGTPVLNGIDASAQFLQGFIMEKALSVDNLFVFALIFTHFSVPREYQHRVLTWGIIATIIMRGTVIGLAIGLLDNFHWLIYIAGAFLVYTGFKMFVVKDDDEFDPDKSLAVRVIRRIVPVTSEYHEDKFMARVNGKMCATPLLLVLLILNVVDIIFAVDSVPAIVAITSDSFLMFSSNMFAILGLRALYFVLAEAMAYFRYLKVSLAFILVFVGGKMLFEGAYTLHKLEAYLPDWADPLVSWLPDAPYKLNTLVSLGVIAVTLAIGMIASHIRAAPTGGDDRHGQ